ncbi:DNA polymerase I [Limnobacter humi]|uniref:DNA polymerase I n=1 Tax=Limnobacter humi TaxID=1778671 RepID=A0ABT1WHP2_9BURK|nr:DNA polymerase I [Limnobacter humi]MCQ8896556.1 DNA polymerase I [Limnobacter humi]
MKRLLLVDGSSYLYRAFHAMPDLRNRAGEPTGAIYGMVNMLRRLRADFPSDALTSNCIACIFDAPGKTFRDDLYPEYKANRSSMPEDLAAQIPHIYEVTKALGWPVIAEPGIEADDVIGTLAQTALRQGFDEVVISTGDKDLAQLVNDKIRLVDTMKNSVMTRDAVFEKFGVYPEQIIDYLTLVGDTVDNVPGVEKVGPKTAAKWLAEYKTLDGVVANASQIGGKVGENLKKALDWLPTGKTLVTVKTDCDIELARHIEDQLQAGTENAEVLKKLFHRFEFKTWFRALGGVPEEPVGVSGDLFSGSNGEPVSSVSNGPNALFDAPTQSIDSIRTVSIQTPDALHELIELLTKAKSAGRAVAFDTETTSLEPMNAQIVGLCFALEPGVGYYIPLGHQDLTAEPQLNLGDTLAALKPWFEDAQAPKIAQNAKYDLHVMANHNVWVQGLVEDTMLASYILEAHKPHGMDALALRWLNYNTIKYEEVAGKGASQISFEQVPIETATRYAAEDAEVTLRLAGALRAELKQVPELATLYDTIELPFSQVLFEVERNGVLIDSAKLDAQSAEIADKLKVIETQAFELAGGEFNLNSPKQIGELLFDKLGLPVVKKTASGAPSTDEEVLSKLAEDYPLPAKLLEHRSLAKLKSTYTDKLPRMVNPRTGRVHTNYAQAVAVTGRLASNDPNLQNIPVRTAEGRRVREAFVAPADHVLVSADYSQIELRIMAHISGDEALIHAFQHGLDIHSATASEIFGVPLGEVNSDQRRTAKVINFGLIYGMSAFGLAANLNINRDAAKLYIDRYFTRYPGVARYMENVRAQAKADGYVSTVFGRRLWLPEIKSPNGPRRAAAERAAINAPMQGTSADLIKMAMVKLSAWLKAEQLQTKMIMQVHDEVILEVPNSELALIQGKVPDIMTQVADLKVPLEVGCGVGLNWEEAH